jgi:hypothetical protein
MDKDLLLSVCHDPVKSLFNASCLNQIDFLGLGFVLNTSEN